jgi:hypothetical protein
MSSSLQQFTIAMVDLRRHEGVMTRIEATGDQG